MVHECTCFEDSHGGTETTRNIREDPLLKTYEFPNQITPEEVKRKKFLKFLLIQIALAAPSFRPLTYFLLYGYLDLIVSLLFIHLVDSSTSRLQALKYVFKHIYVLFIFWLLLCIFINSYFFYWNPFYINYLTFNYLHLFIYLFL
jgi:hypothetical protein